MADRRDRLGIRRSRRSLRYPNKWECCRPSRNIVVSERNRDIGHEGRNKENVHRNQIDKRSSSFRVIDERRLTFFSSLNVSTHMPLEDSKRSNDLAASRRRRDRSVKRTAAFPSVYFRGVPWVVCPPGDWRKRPIESTDVDEYRHSEIGKRRRTYNFDQQFPHLYNPSFLRKCHSRKREVGPTFSRRLQRKHNSNPPDRFESEDSVSQLLGLELRASRIRSLNRDQRSCSTVPKAEEPVNRERKG